MIIAGLNKEKRVSVGFLLLRVGLLVLVTFHMILPGMVRYWDLAGYLCFMAALALLQPILKRFPLTAGVTLAGFILSMVGYVLLPESTAASSGEGAAATGALNVILSSMIALFDLAAVYMACKGFREKGLELKSAEVCVKSSELLRCIAGMVALLLLNSTQGILKLPDFLELFFYAALKILIIMCVTYVYMNLSAMLRAVKQLLEIYE